MKTLQLILKRVLDILLSFLGLVILSPVFLFIIIMIYIKLGSPIFFIQRRPGKDGQSFKMIKFRTMLNTKDKNGNLLPDNKRQTRFGKLLRGTSLDELPELINILRGNMSFVGPRPLLMKYLNLYTAEQARRHEVRPGLTGWAQINGRNAISWEKKFKLDVWYVDNWYLFLDIKIIIITFIKTLKREGINQEGHVTMEEFKGN